MAKPFLSDELWNVTEPHIPAKRRRRNHLRRRPLSVHAGLTGIRFVLVSAMLVTRRLDIETPVLEFAP